MSHLPTSPPPLVGHNGTIQLCEEQQRRWGLGPGAAFTCRETPEGLLVRPADPPLTKVYIEPTSECNLTCRTCVRNTWDEPTGSMPIDVYRRLAEGLAKMGTVRKMSFWGIGEPLMHPDIVDMIATAGSMGAGTEIITNGLLLDRALSRALVEAGLDSIIFSVDGVSPEAFSDVRGGADLARLKENVRQLREIRHPRIDHKPDIGLQFVVMKRNVGELAHLRDLARDMGASSIIVSNILPYTEELSEEILYWLWAGTSYQRGYSTFNPQLVLPRIDARREVLQPLIGLLEHTWMVEPPRGRRDGASGHCRFAAEGALAVSWQGDVSPCVPLMHSYSCYIRGREKRFQKCVLGNVATTDIAAIWASQEFVAHRARLQEFDFPPCTDCAGCEMAETNQEDCFGNTFPTCGDCLWAKGVVHCP